MFTVIAATLFSAALLLATGTMAWMLLAYRDKMIAALLFQPIPQQNVVYHIRIRRPRVAQPARGASALNHGGILAA